MKNMKKLLQKAMVFTLSAAMLIGTPMTASAAELVDLYSISDGTKEVDPGKNPNTGTITNTDTNSGFLIENNKVSIVGIALDRQTVNAEVGVKETLKATVVLDGKIYAEGDIANRKGNIVAEKGQEITDLVVEAMSDKIHWELMYIGADGKVRKDIGNPAEKVGIDLTEEKATNRSVVILTPYHGTKVGEEVTVRASIDAAYCFDPSISEKAWEDRFNEENKVWSDRQETGRDAFYTADAKVSVKECTDKLTWTDGDNDDDDKAETAKSEMIVKHTLDLMPMLVRDPATANDTITWTSSATKVATVSKDGVVTAKKDGKATITAISEHGALATREITVKKGVVADVVKVYSRSVSDNSLEEVTGKTTNKDLAKSEDSEMKLEAVMYVKVSAYTADGKANGTVIQPNGLATDEEGKLVLPEGAKVAKNVVVANGSSYIDANREAKKVEITDKITWTSGKKTVAEVAADGSVTLKGVGSAAITAKATSGKSAKTTVKVAATLGSLAIGKVPTATVYSGQTVNLTADRTPAANNDAVTWGVTGADGKSTKDASIDKKKGVLKIANKVAGEEIIVTLKTSKAVNTPDGKKVVEATPVKIKIAQSTIDTITVTEKVSTALVAYGGSGVSKKDTKSGTSYINVPLSKTYVATATNGEDEGDTSLLTWKTSNAKVAEIDASGANATIKAVGAGKATITVSGVHYDVKKSKASVVSVKFTVQVKQPVTSLTMNKPTVELAEKIKVVKKVSTTQNQKVSLKVTFGPKKADKNQAKIDSWTIQKVGSGEDPKTITTGSGKKEKKVTSASLTYNLIAPKEGEVYKITAKSVTGATATSTITIAAPTTAVQILKRDGSAVDTKKGEELTVGGRLGIKAQINVGTKDDAVWVDAGTPEAKSKNAESVTYTVNKKGIVTIDKDGNIYALKKGNVTITAKTPTGKKATLKIKVK